MSNLPRLFEILLVEDNPGDVLLTREALRDARVLHNLTVARDGQEAMALLLGDGGSQPATRPDIILLDLNLPRMNGLEVLEAIRRQPTLQMLPVVMLTSSTAEGDVRECYQLGVNCFITKPVDVGQFLHVVQSIEQFWLSIVTLPPSPAGTTGRPDAARHE